MYCLICLYMGMVNKTKIGNKKYEDEDKCFIISSNIYYVAIG